ncbi:MAG: HlyD family efflux transporter periplasmic adaptor subunit [Pirellulales bacterium]
MLTSMLLALAIAADAAPAAPAADPCIPSCLITSIDDQAVPAADAGVLTILRVKEGTRVTLGEEIGRIDDSEAQAQLHVKQLEYDVANQTANSDIDIRHADMAAKVAEQAYLMLAESNKTVKGTVTAIDMLKAQLEWKRSRLAIEQAKEKNEEAKLTARAKSAEVGAAQVVLERRVLRAPFDGMVVKVAKKPGEWVAPGDPVVHVVGINRLRVMGNLDASEWGPADVEGRKVTVEVTLPRGETKKVPGTITYVSPVVTIGDLPVSAEIETPLKGELPLVRAGLNASMTIHVNQPVAQAAPATAAPATAAPARAAPARATGVGQSRTKSASKN